MYVFLEGGRCDLAAFLIRVQNSRLYAWHWDEYSISSYPVQHIAFLNQKIIPFPKDESEVQTEEKPNADSIATHRSRVLTQRKETQCLFWTFLRS